MNDRRLFFDWLLHDYIIKENGKSITTIIQKFVKDCNDHLDKEEKKTLKLWADSALRFYEVLDIQKGVGYTITDEFEIATIFIQYHMDQKIYEQNKAPVNLLEFPSYYRHFFRKVVKNTVIFYQTLDQAYIWH